MSFIYNEELKRILDPNDFSWIKVTKYENCNLPAWQELLRLEAHHKAETEFLIKKCRALAGEALSMRRTDD